MGSLIKFNQVKLVRSFPDWSVGTTSSANHLWELGGSVSGLVTGPQRGHPEPFLIVSHRARWFSADGHFPEHKGWGDFLALHCFPEAQSQVKFRFVSPWEFGPREAVPQLQDWRMTAIGPSLS